jgi:hypothetical protein
VARAQRGSAVHPRLARDYFDANALATTAPHTSGWELLGRVHALGDTMSAAEAFAICAQFRRDEQV